MLAQVKGFLWDVDNTLYRYPKDFVDMYFDAAIAMVLQFGHVADKAEARALCERSWRDHKEVGRELELRFGVNREEWFAAFHTHLDHNRVTPCRHLSAHFKRHMAGLPHAALTMGMTAWARRILTHIDFIQHFPEGRIIGREKFHYGDKAKDRLPFDMGAEALQLPFSALCMVEDTPENLRIPKELGMAATIFLHHGKPLERLPDYIDFQYENLAALIDAYAAVNGPVTGDPAPPRPGPLP